MGMLYFHLQEEEDKKAAEPEIVAGLKIMKKPEPGSAAGAAAAAGGSAPAGAAAAAGGGAGSGRPAAGVVGDGGASWRLKALKRAQERAKAEGKSLHEVGAGAPGCRLDCAAQGSIRKHEWLCLNMVCVCVCVYVLNIKQTEQFRHTRARSYPQVPTPATECVCVRAGGG